jgi:hypothetical protein
VEVGATSEATKKSEVDMYCCTRSPASDEAQQITTKKKHSRGDELRGKINEHEESGGVRDRRETCKRGNAECRGMGRKGDDAGSGGRGRGSVFVRSVYCVLRDALMRRANRPSQVSVRLRAASHLCLLRRAMIRTFAAMTPLFY